MRKTPAPYRIIAIMAAVVVLAGTQGFVVSSHTCATCGTFEEQISLFGSQAGDNHTCSSQESEGSCCSPAGTESEPAESPACCNSESQAPACETTAPSQCCTHNSERVVVETYSQEKSVRAFSPFQPVAVNIITDVTTAVSSHTRFAAPGTAETIPVPDIFRKNCSLLL